MTDDLKKAIDDLLTHIAKMHTDFIENDEVERGDLEKLFDAANELIFEFGAAIQESK